jgi:hypothetical protein
METIEYNGIRIDIDSAAKEVYDFTISQDDIMNSNNLGYAITWRQQCFINHKRTEQRKKLVQMGMDAANEHCPSMSFGKVFVLVEVSNLTEQRFDPPNFEPTEKHIMDGLVKGGLLIDDNSNVIQMTVFKELQEEKDRDNYKMRISVYRLPER